MTAKKKRMLRSNAILLLFLLILFNDCRHSYCAVESTLTFENSACTGSLANSSFKCVTMFAQISFSNSDSNSTFYNTITSYVDSSGNQVTLSSPITIEVSITNATAFLPIISTQVMYNKYEVYEPGESCAISYNYGLCKNPDTRPLDQSIDYVLCCIDRAKRGNGGHCYRYDYNAKYEWYQVYAYTKPSNAMVAITKRGNVYQYPLQYPVLQYSINNEGFASISSNSGESIIPIVSLAGQNIVRDARDPSIPITDISKWFIIGASDFNFQTTGSRFMELATCDRPMNQFATHDIPSQINDQYYVVRNNTLINTLKLYGAEYPDSIQVIPLKNNIQVPGGLQIEFMPDMSLVQIVVYNININ